MRISYTSSSEEPRGKGRPLQKTIRNVRSAVRLRRLARRSPLIIICGTIIVAVASLAVFADFLSLHDPIVQDVPNRLKPPGGEFFLGTDNFGRDIFSRIIYGSRSSLYISLTSVLAGAVIGTLIGMISAYRGGWLDLILQRIVDTLLGFPSLVLAVIMVVALGASTNTVIVAIAAALIPQATRLSRACTLSVREEGFVLAAQAIGAPPQHVMLKHVLPHIIAPVLAYATGYVGVALLAESALSFLGLGVPPPYPSWGGMLQESRLYLERAPWLTIFPGLALSITVLSFTLLGDALQDILDPRAVRRGSRA
ncbi:MAG: ABC transporter permease [Thaumarchaeota archaeon]|nr:ABC transporter permease [Nitrososphaerota archaeon]